MNDELLTPDEVGRILKCSRSKVYELRSSGALVPRHKLFEGQKGWRYSRRDVEVFLSQTDTLKDRSPEFPAPFVPVKIARDLWRKN